MDRQTRQILDLLDAMGPQLVTLLVRLTLRREVAQELMQDLFLKLHRSSAFATARNPEAYAYRVAVRLGLDWRKAHSTRPEPLSLEIDPAGPDPSTLTQLIHAEETERVLDAIGRLDEPYRHAVVMRWLEQESYETIAVSLGKTPHQVRGLCHWALRQLRERLQVERVRGKEDRHAE